MESCAESEQPIAPKKSSESEKEPNPTVYVLFWHPEGTHTYSFYKFDIPNPLSPTGNPIPDVKHPALSPILEFTFEKCQNHMTCAKLGFKFYFFPRVESYELPGDVYVFDSESAADKNPKTCAPMNKGKVIPIVFVADEKIFVLDGDGCFYENHSFEVFDPNTNRWTLLDDPPCRKHGQRSWINCIVVKRKVYFWAKDGIVAAILNLDTNKWTQVPPKPKLRTPFWYPPYEFVEDAMYGIDDQKPAKFGPLSKEEKEAEDEKWFSHSLNLVSMDVSDDAIWKAPGVRHRVSLCHVGDRQFCYLISGSAVPDDRCSCTYSTCDHYPDKHKRYLKICVFKELRDKETSSSSTGFNAKFLHSSCYVIETSFRNIGPIANCYAITPAEKKNNNNNNNSNITDAVRSSASSSSRNKSDITNANTNGIERPDYGPELKKRNRRKRKNKNKNKSNKDANLDEKQKNNNKSDLSDAVRSSSSSSANNKSSKTDPNANGIVRPDCEPELKKERNNKNKGKKGANLDQKKKDALKLALQSSLRELDSEKIRLVKHLLNIPAKN